MPEITKQDALRWLDMQRDAVNTEIAYAAPADQKQYHENLKIINWLAERTQEMTAVEYLETLTKMCYKAEHCKHCAFTAQRHGYADLYCFPCTAEEQRDCRRAVEIVKKWKEEHK